MHVTRHPLTSPPLNYRPLNAVGETAPAEQQPTLAWQLFTRGAMLLKTWQQRARTRRQLRGLSDRMLKDIGVSRDEALAESSKAFWQK